jgi:type II secretory pathway component HofQ
LYISPHILSGNFYGYGSYSQTNDTNAYYITEVFQAINISQHKVPYVGLPAFNTESYG